MKNKILLGPDRILSFRKYVNDPFNMILNFMVSEKFAIDLNYTYVSKRFSQLDKIYWKSMRPILPATSMKKGGMTKGFEVIHHGIHYALSQKYSKQLVGMPSITLLSEAIASSADIYFTFIYFQKYNVNHPCVDEHLGYFQKSCKKVNVPYVSLFNELMRDPWKSFQTSVLDMFSVLSFLLEVSHGQHGEEYNFKKALAQVLDSCKSYGFIAGYDLHSFIAYSHFHCGPKSHTKDKNAVKDCLLILKNAESMESFLSEIGISRLYESKNKSAA